MRTTLILNDNLVREAKIRAAESNTSFSAIVNDALREKLLRQKRVSDIAAYKIPVYNGSSPAEDLTPDRIAAFRDNEDLEDFSN